MITIKKDFTHAALLLFMFLNGLLCQAQVITLLNEDFSSGSFLTNNWSFPNGQGNWNIGSSNTPAGASAPNAFFNWAPSVPNYSFALESPVINATSINGPVTLDYLLLLNPLNTATAEQFKVEYKTTSSSTWNLLANYSNTPTVIHNWPISNAHLSGVQGQNFQIRFTAYGINSFNITRWSLDNIVVRGTNCLPSLPPLSITAPATVCAGSSATLIASGGGSSYTWSPAGGNGSVAIVSPTINTTYALISSLPGCSATPVGAVTTITVFTNPVNITATSSSSLICAGNTVALNAAGAPNYSWSTGASTSSILLSPTITTTYSVSNTSSLGCLSTQTVTVTVNPNPTITVINTNSAVCSGSTTALIASGAHSYTWNNGSTGAIITLTPFSSNSYTVTGTDAQGCFSSDSIIVYVYPPVTLTPTGSTTLCSGSSVSLSASGVTSYTWNTNATTPVITVSPISNTIFSVMATDIHSCITSASVQVQVLPNPTVSLISSSSVICAGSSLSISASGADTYTWNTGYVGQTGIFTPTINTVYSVTGTSAGGCTGSHNTVSLSITVDPIPVLTIHGTPSLICSGSATSLTALGANSYSWNTGAMGPSIIVTPSVSTTYYVTGTNTLLCSSTMSLNVQVTPSPVLSIVRSNTSVCTGGTVTLLAQGAGTYTWNNGSQVNLLYDSPASTTIYTVTGTNSGNCTGTATVEVSVDPYPVISMFSSDSVICASETATLTADGAPEFLWSTGQTGSIITISPYVSTTYTVTGNYKGCKTSSILTQQINPCTGISYYSKEENIRIYPNPGSGLYFLTGAFTSENTHIRVYNDIGSLILSMYQNNGEIDIRQVPPGLYFIEVHNGIIHKTFKVIRL